MNNKTISVLIFGLLSGISANSFAAIGLVKICIPTDAPQSPNRSRLVLEQNAKFYQSPTGENDGALSIVVSQIGQSDARGCSYGSAATSIQEQFPKNGTKWYRVATDEGWKDGASNGMYTSTKVSYKIPVEAEAIGNFMVSRGKLTICRMPHITEHMDGKQVDIPADTYTGACDRNGENCRNIQLKGEKGDLGPRKSSCITVNAELIATDGKPIKKGERLLEQWNVPGFTPSIHAATDFK